MSAKNAINTILHNATGKRASGRDLLVSEKRSILEPAAAAVLKEQWKSAGRDNSLVVMRLTDEEGTNPHYVTGWDGKDTFVCMTESGLTYIDYRKLEKLKTDADWNSQTRLIEVRAPLLRENMERADVDMLIDRIKKTLTKSSKSRRKGRLRNMEKFFAAAVVDESSTNAEKAAASGPDSETEFEKVDEKDDRTPSEEPPGRNKAESVTRLKWNRVGPAGEVKVRRLSHVKMEASKTDLELAKRELVRMDSEGKGGGSSASTGGNKCDPQLALRELVRMDKEGSSVIRQEDKTDLELAKRELVRMDSEGKGGGAASPGGNKTDVQLGNREQIDVRHEDKAQGAKDASDDPESPDYTTYAGEKAKDKEFASRPKIAVRHEGLSISEKGKKLFGPKAGKKSPVGAKKGLLMLVMMGKKKPMAEETSYCPRCGTTHVLGDHPKDKFGPQRGLFPRPPKSKPGEAPQESCPTCAAKRAKSGGGLKLKMRLPKKESLARYGLNLFEGKKKIPKAFLANIEKMRAKSKGSKTDGDDDKVDKSKFGNFGKADKSDDKAEKPCY